MSNTLEQTMNDFDDITAEPADEPLMRPFEMIAIGCGVATLAGTFLVSSPLLKGLLIGGSLLALIGSLLYYGVANTKETIYRIRTSVPRPGSDTASMTMH